jgi:hypothetical protein
MCENCSVCKTAANAIYQDSFAQALFNELYNKIERANQTNEESDEQEVYFLEEGMRRNGFEAIVLKVRDCMAEQAIEEYNKKVHDSYHNW